MRKSVKNQPRFSQLNLTGNFETRSHIEASQNHIPAGGTMIAAQIHSDEGQMKMPPIIRQQDQLANM